MRKLYTDVTLDPSSAFMVTYNNVQTQACANDEDTITIGSTEYVRITDENGHNVKAVIPASNDSTPRQLLLHTGEGSDQYLCYIEEGGEAVSSTNVQVTDVTPEPPVVRHTYTYYLFNDETASFTCSDEGATITSNTVTAAEGATITFSFSKTGYQTLSGTTTMGSSDEYVTINLVREGYVPAWTSSGSEVGETFYTADYPPQIGDAINTSAFDQIYTVGGIETIAGVVTGIMTSDVGMIYSRDSGSDMPDPSIAVITVVPHPTDATVTLTAQGFTQQGNSISVDVGTQVSCQVTREGFISIQQTITANETQAVTVNLDSYRLTNPSDNTLSYDPNESPDGDYWLYYGADGLQGQVAVYDMYAVNTKYAQIRLSETPITMNNTEYYPVIANSGSELYPDKYVTYQPQGYDHDYVLMVTSSLDGLYIWDVETEYEPEICLELALTHNDSPVWDGN